MPRVLQETDIDPIAEQVDMDMMETGDAVAPPVHKFDPNTRVDLSDGGNIGGVRMVPLGESGRIEFDRARREPGRPTTRAAWTWDGRPTELPLAWNPSGEQHDGARKYLLKRHCVVCNFSGFYGLACPACRKAGRPAQRGAITPAYYLRLAQVPDPAQPFGVIACIVRACVRRGQYGFHTDAEMRQHAASRHRQEYRAFQEAAMASSKTELDHLREQLNAIMAAQGQQGVRTEAQKQARNEALRKARAAKAQKQPA